MSTATQLQDDDDSNGLCLADLVRPLRRARLALLQPLGARVVAVGLSFLAQSNFTARASFLSPQAAGGAAAALASLGYLATLAGAARSPAEQDASSMDSVTEAERLFDRFDLGKVFDEEKRGDARSMLHGNTWASIGKKGGLIVVEFGDHDPKRAAEVANQYIVELRVLIGRLALSEEQQQRMFFKGLMTTARDDMSKARLKLRASGFNCGILRAEPYAAAESYARTGTEVSATELWLRAAIQKLAETAHVVQRLAAQPGALRSQLTGVEPADNGVPSDYLDSFRELKYEESLLGVFARQFEGVQVDEAHEGALIQVVDAATPLECKSKAKRSEPGNRTTLLPLPASARSLLINGDVLRALNLADVQRSMGLQNKRVRIEGEVTRPDGYLMPTASTLDDALRAASGGTPTAYYRYATEFTRESVRQTQQQNYKWALRDFRTQVTRETSMWSTTNSDEAMPVAAAGASSA